MAEIVEYRQELKLSFYEDLKNSGVLSKTKNSGNGGDRAAENDKGNTDTIDIKELMRQEESFEKKINSPLKTVDDFYDFIKFKSDLFAKLAIRAKGNTRARPFQRMIRDHIKKLYKGALTFFPNDIDLWAKYIHFCKVSKIYTEGSAAYEKMLTFHGGDPKYWLEAIQWECDQTKNMENAKKLLLNAIHRHPEHPNLYIKLFKILLSMADSEESPDYRLALALYENSRSYDFKIDYWAKVLEIAEEYRFSKKLQGLLVKYMVDKFVGSELTWHILAQRELKGFPTGAIIKHYLEKRSEHLNSKNEVCVYQEDDVNYNECEKRRIQLCAKIYQAALSVVNTEKMWTHYIDAMLNLNKDMTSEKVLKRHLLGAAFSGGLEAKRLTENHFRAYVDLLMESDASNVDIVDHLRRGLALYPESAILWELLMNYYIIQDQEKEVKEVFQEGCQKLKDPELAYPLWRKMLRYYQTIPEKYDYVYNIFAKACNEPSPKFLPIRVLYLEFCIINQSVEQVRQVYSELVTIPPPYLELHKRMALFESHLLNPDFTNWRKCHQNAVQFFGKERSDVWIDYIDFEKFYGDASKITHIYTEALNSLQGNMKKKFISDYNIFNAINLIQDD